MRIIAGKCKGMTLNTPKSDKIRPTSDKVREAVFSKISFDISGARCVDLFSGTGALGIEALSRGAGEVVFVDRTKEGVTLTIQNLQKCGLDAKVMLKDAKKALLGFSQPFDVIFLDPPYKSGVYNEILEIIKEKSLLKENGIIVCEHAKSILIDFSDYNVFAEKEYGTVMISYLTEK